MALNNLLLLASFLLILCSVVAIEAATGISPPLNRSSFPDGFIFGTASSAYQVLQLFQLSFFQLCILDWIALNLRLKPVQK